MSAKKLDLGDGIRAMRADGWSWEGIAEHIGDTVAEVKAQAARFEPHHDDVEEDDPSYDSYYYGGVWLEEDEQ